MLQTMWPSSIMALHGQASVTYTLVGILADIDWDVGVGLPTRENDSPFGQTQWSKALSLINHF